MRGDRTAGCAPLCVSSGGGYGMIDRLWRERGIAYRTNAFEKSRKTLVFVHGLGTTCSGWVPFEAALENQFNILTYDLRGHGFSQRYRNYSDYALNHLAEDLRALLEHVSIDTFSLVSNSLGTLVALLYMHRYPGTVERSLLLAPLYKGKPLNSTAEGAKSFPMGLLSCAPVVRRAGRRVDYAGFEHAEDLDWRRILAEIKAMSLRVYLFYLHQLNIFKEYGLWSQIRTPTTIVHGTNDSFAPYHLAVELSKVIPGAKLVTLERANHIVIINNRQDIILQIRNG